METGISEASKRVSIFSFTTQGGKQVNFYFRQGNWVQAREAQQKLETLLSQRTGAREAHERQTYIVGCLGEECPLSRALSSFISEGSKKERDDQKERQRDA